MDDRLNYRITDNPRLFRIRELDFEFVENHSKVKMDNDLRTLSQEVLYSSEVEVAKEAVEQMRSLTKLWINTHGASDD